MPYAAYPPPGGYFPPPQFLYATAAAPGFPPYQAAYRPATPSHVPSPVPPPPWQMVRDAATGQPYYFNPETGSTQWHFPTATPAAAPPAPAQASASPAIPMPDPQAEPEAYEAWKAVMEHVQGGVASKMTGRDLDAPRPVSKPPTEKPCVDYVHSERRRGDNHKFSHDPKFRSDEPRPKRDDDDAASAAPAGDSHRERHRRRRRDEEDDDGYYDRERSRRREDRPRSRRRREDREQH